MAWYGPIVMNTRQQLQQAISELRDGIGEEDNAIPLWFNLSFRNNFV